MLAGAWDRDGKPACAGPWSHDDQGQSQYLGQGRDGGRLWSQVWLEEGLGAGVSLCVAEDRSPSMAGSAGPHIW